MVNECEELVKRMNKVFAEHDIVKPVEVFKARSLKMTSRVGDVKLTKTHRKKEGEGAAEKRHAQQTIEAISRLKQKEKSLKEEEDLAN